MVGIFSVFKEHRGYTIIYKQAIMFYIHPINLRSYRLPPFFAGIAVGERGDAPEFEAYSKIIREVHADYFLNLLS